MEYTKLQNTDLEISVFALGTGSYASHVSEPVSELLLDRFIDQGGTMIDTANYYGRWNPGNKPLSEMFLGKWIEKNNLRHKIVLATKGACYPVNQVHSPRVTPDCIRTDLYDSLKNLRTDYIDLYWLHQDDPNQPVEGIIDILNEFVHKGIIRYFGCSNWRVPRMEAAADYAREKNLKSFAASQVMFNLASPNMEALNELKQSWVDGDQVAYYTETQMPLYAYTSQANGVFSIALRDDFLFNAKFATARKYFLNNITLDRVKRVKQLSEEINRSPIEICLGFLRSQDFQVIPIIGPHTIDELNESLKGADCMLSKEQIDFILG